MSDLSYIRIFDKQPYQCIQHCHLQYIFQGLPNGIIDPVALSKILSKAPCNLASGLKIRLTWSRYLDLQGKSLE